MKSTVMAFIYAVSSKPYRVSVFCFLVSVGSGGMGGGPGRMEVLERSGEKEQIK